MPYINCGKCGKKGGRDQSIPQSPEIRERMKRQCVQRRISKLSPRRQVLPQNATNCSFTHLSSTKNPLYLEHYITAESGCFSPNYYQSFILTWRVKKWVKRKTNPLRHDPFPCFLYFQIIRLYTDTQTHTHRHKMEKNILLSTKCY